MFNSGELDLPGSPLVRKNSWIRPNPATVMLIVAAVDAADGALLGASFPAFQKWLNLSPTQLGTLMMLQTGSGCVMLPVWGWLLRHHGYKRLLMWAVSAWAASTLITAFAASYKTQCLLRVINGASLSCVMPFSQALLAESTAESKRGRAFGVFSAVENLCRIVIGYAVVASGDAWRTWYYIVFAATLGLLALLQRSLPAGDFGRTTKPRLSYASSVKVILTLPSFIALIAQGVTGATPWRAMAFLNLLWLSAGHSNSQAASITSLANIGAVFGCYIGGRIGDMAAKRMPNSGRIAVAQGAVLAGIPLWVLWLRCESHFYLAIAVGFLFYLVATWPGVAACRPICAELVEDSADRANIVSLWAFIEGAAAAVVGGPVVGALTEWYGYRLNKDAADIVPENAQALRRALTNTGALTWGLCFAFWTCLYHTFPRDKERMRRDSESRTED